MRIRQGGSHATYHYTDGRWVICRYIEEKLREKQLEKNPEKCQNQPSELEQLRSGICSPVAQW
jgi:hypothetical protein